MTCKSDLIGVFLFALVTLTPTVVLSFIPTGDASSGMGVVSATVTRGGFP